MNMGVQNDQMQNHQKTAQKLLEQSHTLKDLFQDQWFYVWSLTPQNLFIIDQENKKLSIADGLLALEFCEHGNELIRFSTPHPQISVQKIADFIFNEISFLISDLKAQNSLFLQTKVQLFRQLLVEEVFKWVDGESRIEEFLYNISAKEAHEIDQLMIDAGYYSDFYLTEYATLGKNIPLTVELNFKHLCLMNSILGENFLATQKIIPIYEQLCLSAESFIPQPIYRIIETSMGDHFCLADILEHQQDFELLMDHAKESPQLLAFAQWMKRGYWQYRDIFSKQNFLSENSEYWDQSLKKNYPICAFKRTANWLFKQDSLVVDWIAQNIEDANVRVTMTVLSFLDTTKFHPQIILSTLKYFKSSAARIFIQECSQFATKNNWFDVDNDQQEQEMGEISQPEHPYVLVDDQPIIANHQNIRPSLLYIEEWLHLLSMMSAKDPKIAKTVFKQMSRVVQAYMLFLHHLIKDIPNDLIDFIEPETQQNPLFFHALRKHQIDVDDFRKLFKHQNVHLNQSLSIFDSYVADYLMDLFNQHKAIAKNVTWIGLYQKAVRWHQKAYFEDTLAKLRLKIYIDSWRRVSPQKIMFTERWKFIELNSLEQIIHESLSYKHCLALSYTEMIAQGEYVAFHMSSLENESIHLTLGCFYKFEKLHFDQLRLPNNEKPSDEMTADAQAFLEGVNQYLIWDFKAPKVK